MFWRSQSVGIRIAEVAAEVENPEVFSKRAREVAQTLGHKVVGKSRAYLLNPPEKPQNLAGKFDGFGEWMSVCQAAIFEIWYHRGEEALRDLRRIAFGVYDWTQAHATKALIRLAEDGIDTDRTVNDIAKALPTWRYEQVMQVRGAVAKLAAKSDALQTVYDAVTAGALKEDPIDGFELIAANAEFNPTHVLTRYETVLRQLVAGTALEGRTAYDDGHVVASGVGGLIAKSGPTYPQIEAFHQIRAALLLHQLLPNDHQIGQQLRRWAQTHPDEGVRQKLHEILSRPGPEAGAL